MITSITIVRYNKWLAWAGFLSMVFFRIPLSSNQTIKFWKLMGTGKNGGFDKIPDLNQWAILTVFEDINKIKEQPNFDHSVLENAKNNYGKFIAGWWSLFRCEIWTVILEPIEGHGYWDGKQPFGNLPKNTDYDGPIAVLTRATIKLNKLNSFWSNVAPVSNKMIDAEGLIGTFGIGEIPWIKQATFSFWESKASMKNFAYKMQEHAAVISKTRKEQWYSEDMFIRFKPITSFGKLKGIDLLKRNSYIAHS